MASNLRQYFEQAISNLCVKSFNEKEFALFVLNLNNDQLSEICLMCAELENIAILQELKIQTAINKSKGEKKAKLLTELKQIDKKIMATAKLREFLQGKKELSDHSIRGTIRYIDLYLKEDQSERSYKNRKKN